MTISFSIFWHFTCSCTHIRQDMAIISHFRIQNYTTKRKKRSGKLDNVYPFFRRKHVSINFISASQECQEINGDKKKEKEEKKPTAQAACLVAIHYYNRYYKILLKHDLFDKLLLMIRIL